MSSISAQYSIGTASLYAPVSFSPSQNTSKRIAITKETPGAMPLPEEMKKELAEAQAHLDSQRLATKKGMQTDGTLYWLNGKGNSPLISKQDCNGINVDAPGENIDIGSFGSHLNESEIATTTAKGTRVSVQSIPANVTNGVGSSVVKLLNIETKSGLQIQMNLDQNMRINDLENGGLSLYFPDTGETKIFDGDGNITETNGETSGTLSGTTADDVLININKASIDAGDGNDTVFNFSDNTIINAGDGDDKVILPGSAQNVIINTGEGNNTVYGGQLRNSIVNAQGSNDALNFFGLSQSTMYGNTDATGLTTVNVSQFYDSYALLQGKADINMSLVLNSVLKFNEGNNNAKINNLNNSSLNTGGGDNSVKIDNLSDSSLNTGGGDNSVTLGNLSNSSLNTGGGDNSIKIDNLRDSSLHTGNGKNTLDISHAHESTIQTGDGDDTVLINHMYMSSVDMGGGNDTFIGLTSQNSSVNMGDGDDTVVINSAGASTIDTGDGKDTVYYGNVANVKFGLNTEKDKIYYAPGSAIYRLRDNPSKENWDTMQSIAHRYFDQTHLFKNYNGGGVSLFSAANSLTYESSTFSRNI